MILHWVPKCWSCTEGSALSAFHLENAIIIQHWAVEGEFYTGGFVHVLRNFIELVTFDVIVWNLK